MTNNPLIIKFKALHPKAVIPTKAFETDAGFDLVSVKTLKINGHVTGLVPTGLAFDIPVGYYAQIVDRSGIAATKTLKVKAGVIDSGYRGEINVVLGNHGSYPVEILQGEKIAQLVILPVPEVEFKKTGTLTKSPRDTDGFGSTDKK